ncbi:MAG: hypothetical protein Q9174_004052 [Haloplaca sp. 1 TL-2023]
MSFRFLDLPPEIRDQIYHDILSCDTARCPPDDDDKPGSYKFDLEILRANRQIHRESRKAFEDNIFIKITTPWHESIDHISSEGRVPIIATGPPAEDFRSFHLWAWIDAPGVPHRDNVYSMVICLHDLPAFTRMWRFSNLNHEGLNPHLRLKLILQDPHVPERKLPKSLQNLLLRPFGDVKDLHSFQVEGARVLPSVEEALKRDQAASEPTPEECLETATALKDAGNKCILVEDYQAALRHYTDAFAAIHITISGRKRYIHADGYYGRDLLSGTYQGQRSDYVRLILRVKLVANFIHTYIKLQDWDEARFWGRRSVITFRSSMTGETSDDLGGGGDSWAWVIEASRMGFPAQVEMGKIFHRTATASKELGYDKEAANLAQAAEIYLPEDQRVKAMAASYVNGYRWRVNVR